MGERALGFSESLKHHGDVNEPRDADGGPGEGSLPSLTAHRLKNYESSFLVAREHQQPWNRLARR